MIVLSIIMYFHILSGIVNTRLFMDKFPILGTYFAGKKREIWNNQALRNRAKTISWKRAKN